MNVDSGCVISGQAKPCGRTITCRLHWEGGAAAALVPETVPSAATSGMWKEGGLLVSFGDRHHGPWEREVEVDAVHVVTVLYMHAPARRKLALAPDAGGHGKGGTMMCGGRPARGRPPSSVLSHRARVTAGSRMFGPLSTDRRSSSRGTPCSPRLGSARATATRASSGRACHGHCRLPPSKDRRCSAGPTRSCAQPCPQQTVEPSSCVPSSAALRTK